jgi:hypothetical protein
MNELMQTAADALATHFDSVEYNRGGSILVAIDGKWFKVEVTEIAVADEKEGG